MHRLIEGLHQFQKHVVSSRREEFARLAEGQSPRALFITCSDSRIDPNLLTQTGPGELFVLRNAGNIVPPHGASSGGEAAAVEYAVSALGVSDIIVCGHSHCGAMKGLLAPESLEALPQVREWLSHAAATRQVATECHGQLDGAELLNATIEENVRMQLENLRTHPAVAAKLRRNEIALHGWVYRIETGEVLAYDPAEGRFAPLISEEVPAAR